MCNSMLLTGKLILYMCGKLCKVLLQVIKKRGSPFYNMISITEKVLININS